jgi:hypothetical protein
MKKSLTLSILQCLCCIALHGQLLIPTKTGLRELKMPVSSMSSLRSNQQVLIDSVISDELLDTIWVTSLKQYNYFRPDCLIAFDSLAWTGFDYEDFRPFFTETYIYGDDQLLDTFIDFTYNYNDGTGTSNYREISFYNGNLLHYMKVERATDQLWDSTEAFYYVYDLNQRLQTVFTADSLSRVDYTYNTGGYLISFTSYNRDNILADFDTVYREGYLYDVENNLVTILEDSYENGIWTLEAIFSLEYASDNRPIAYKYFYLEGIEPIPYSRGIFYSRIAECTTSTVADIEKTDHDIIMENPFNGGYVTTTFEAEGSIEIYDMYGRRVLEQQLVDGRCYIPNPMIEGMHLVVLKSSNGAYKGSEKVVFFR